jgi:hypothetical protein
VCACSGCEAIPAAQVTTAARGYVYAGVTFVAYDVCAVQVLNLLPKNVAGYLVGSAYESESDDTGFVLCHV